MTLLRTSETLLKRDIKACPQCKSEMILRAAKPYPVVTQILFGVSFFAFLMFFDTVRHQPSVIWAWTIAQIGLGILLVRGRMSARKRDYRCVRCDGHLG